jgi:hypothetical protein
VVDRERQVRCATATIQHLNRRALEALQLAGRLDQLQKFVDLGELALHVRSHLPVLIHDPDRLQECVGPLGRQRQRLGVVVRQVGGRQRRSRMLVAMDQRLAFFGQLNLNILDGGLEHDRAVWYRQHLVEMRARLGAVVVLRDILLGVEVRKLKLAPAA